MLKGALPGFESLGVLSILEATGDVMRMANSSHISGISASTVANPIGADYLRAYAYWSIARDCAVGVDRTWREVGRRKGKVETRAGLQTGLLWFIHY